jgi:predicted RNA-binding Zn ribbon-like protein
MAKTLISAPPPTLCLDYANTLAWRGSASTESLHGLNDLVAWCEGAGVPARQDARPRDRNAVDADLFPRAIAIRETIFRVFFAIAANEPLKDDDLHALNAALSDAPQRVGIARTKNGFAWRVAPSIPAMTLLAPILWSAADLLAGPSLDRVRHCANERCLWLFLDDSKSGNRRWCSMQACGNRAKAHRHYLRHKSQVGAA